jgi:predicted  nucleic acid-binding Zn-ribbon protein
MQHIILWTALFLIISFWVLGYLYVRTQDEIKQHESELSLLKTRLEHRKKGLLAEEEKLRNKIKELHDQLQEINEN